jgi:DNA-binding transcriptional MerR regulator
LATPQIPDKTSFKSSEVCQYTDTQPYVLRFWESEFPQLRPDRVGGGQPLYTRRDVELVLRIKQLLHEEEVTLEDARRRLEEELAAGGPQDRVRQATLEDFGATKVAPDQRRAPRDENSAVRAASRGRDPQELRESIAAVAPQRPTEADAADPGSRRSDAGNGRSEGFGSVSRERYEDAVDEIAHLRLQLKEAETAARRAEHGLRDAKESAEKERRRAALAIERLEQVLRIVS